MPFRNTTPPGFNGGTVPNAIKAPRFICSSGTPSGAIGTVIGVGGGSGCTVVGTDEGGVVTLLTGSNAGSAGPGTMFIITYSGGAFPVGSIAVFDYGDITTAQQFDQFTNNRVLSVAGNATTWTVSYNGSAALATGLTLTFAYTAKGF